jgi:hypothetical protein
MNEKLLMEKLQRSGLAAIIGGILSQDVNDPEALALQVTTADVLMKVIEEHPVGDLIDEHLMKMIYKFAERGVAKESVLDQVKGILNKEGGE